MFYTTNFVPCSPIPPSVFNVTLGLSSQSFLCTGSRWLTPMEGEEPCYLFKYTNRLREKSCKCQN
ncbi:hypothetical protein Nmel_000355 [Mimus melanotis]